MLLNEPCVPLLPTAVPDLFHAGQPVMIGSQERMARAEWRTNVASGGVLLVDLGPLQRPDI